MRGSPRAVSTPESTVCPMCEVGRLAPRGSVPVRCGSCGSIVSGTILGILRRIIALPVALGAHACECGHPEMRRLPVHGDLRSPERKARVDTA